MDHKLKLVVLDYPKLQLKSGEAQKALTDILIAKQLNYERASDKYLSISPHDLIGTQILIYSEVDEGQRRVVAGLRVDYSNRARNHRIAMPVESIIPQLSQDQKKKCRNFIAKHPTLVQVGAGFVDPDYTFSNTGLRLMELTFFVALHFSVRKGFDHWLTTTNERFKASRWALPTGESNEAIVFTHPQVPDPHKLLMFETLNYSWLLQRAVEYSNLMNNCLELTPPRSQTNGELLMTRAQADELIRKKSEFISRKGAA